jgi:hypothetical protein
VEISPGGGLLLASKTGLILASAPALALAHGDEWLDVDIVNLREVSLDLIRDVLTHGRQLFDWEISRRRCFAIISHPNICFRFPRLGAA